MIESLKGIPVSPEILVPRLGEQLVGMGLVTAAQMSQALALQSDRLACGTPLLLGQALIELGFLDRPTLDRAVTEQIQSLRAALEDSNHHLELRVQQRTLELQEALSRLSEMNQLKANFIANVSHELRTPLTHVRGYLDLLHSEALGEINPEQKKALDVSISASLRLQGLIDDLILFSQASRGQMTLSIGSVNMEHLAARLQARFGLRAQEHQLSLDVSIDGPLPAVQADEEKLSWAISHLLENAIKFTNPGGKVTLKIFREQAAINLVTVLVSDTGIGISPDRVKEIFEPFHQLDGSATRRYGGTGLGLSLVLQIVESHGSVIQVQSELGKGTAISFPLLISKGA